MNKYGWAAIGALTVLWWPWIVFVPLAILSRSFEVLSEVTRPNPPGVTIIQTTAQQPMTTDQLYEKLSQARREDKERQERRDDRQDESIKDIRTSIDNLAQQVKAQPTPPAPPSNSGGRGQWLN
jgi:hypothetical protein